MGKTDEKFIYHGNTMYVKKHFHEQEIGRVKKDIKKKVAQALKNASDKAKKNAVNVENLKVEKRGLRSFISVLQHRLSFLEDRIKKIHGHAIWKELISTIDSPFKDGVAPSLAPPTKLVKADEDEKIKNLKKELADRNKALEVRRKLIKEISLERDIVTDNILAKYGHKGLIEMMEGVESFDKEKYCHNNGIKYDNG